MKIISIFVETPAKQTLFATSDSQNLKNVKQMLNDIPDIVKAKEAYHLLEKDNVFYYARCINQNTMAISLDQFLDFKTNQRVLDALFSAIKDAKTNDDLLKIMLNPVDAINVKINHIKQSTVDILNVLKVTNGKLLKQEEYLEKLLPKAELLAKQAQGFRTGANDLKTKTKLGCLYFFYKPLKDLLDKAKSYTFIPTKSTPTPSFNRG